MTQSYPQAPPPDPIINPLMVQADLQKNAYNLSPFYLNEKEQAEFFIWNQLALIHELAEAGEEIGWKPWATSRHMNRDEYLGEMVDAFHFFLNLLLITGVGWHEFLERYVAKARINLERQQKGYDGVSGKCPFCHRDIATTPGFHVTHPDEGLHCGAMNQCTSQHAVKAPEANADATERTDATVTKQCTCDKPSDDPTTVHRSWCDLA